MLLLQGSRRPSTSRQIFPTVVDSEWALQRSGPPVTTLMRTSEATHDVASLGSSAKREGVAPVMSMVGRVEPGNRMSDRPEDSAESNLTDADRELRAMLARGYTFRETATRLGITMEEFEQSRSRILRAFPDDLGRRGEGGPSGLTGVREPRRPLPPADSGSATQEPPDQPKSRP
jgi:hypothetical protein